MTLPTIIGRSWVLMRVGEAVGVQNYGRITKAYAWEKARKYAAATSGEYELVEVEHIEREAKRVRVVPTEGVATTPNDTREVRDGEAAERPNPDLLADSQTSGGG